MSIATEIEDDPDVVDGVYYPSEDGKPMALTVVHTFTALELVALLRMHISRTDKLVGCDNFWYWEEGNPKARISPDIMVCLGVDGESIERSYLMWRHHNVVPSVCFEFASRGTYRKNLTQTKDIYERLGVSEYFLFDPDYKYVKAGLLGFRLKKGKYVSIPAETDGSMQCKSLNFRLIPVGRCLRLADPKTGRVLPTQAEETDLQHCRADAQQRRADEEQRRADEEQRRADDLQKEVERLRAQLHSKKPRTNGGQSRST